MLYLTYIEFLIPFGRQFTVVATRCYQLARMLNNSETKFPQTPTILHVFRELKQAAPSEALSFKTKIPIQI
jgi:hypothetical protein